jgi:hypothetical protein
MGNRWRDFFVSAPFVAGLAMLGAVLGGAFGLALLWMF